ncbi:hypothetical protein RchiOBHm_Chr3g0467371 [Rosa chinensis]|uniref:Uncharacterized protein n=1 Tax=Rosa chinensis TaxID=74649 RepID=A0A2P6RA91_ROSCH|nr:hypothetical protein RchiOBHm_Chr3g0467371 [Rosa chinensis]
MRELREFVFLFQNRNPICVWILASRPISYLVSNTIFTNLQPMAAIEFHPI